MQEIGFTTWFSRDTILLSAIRHLDAINCRSVEIAAMPEYLSKSKTIRASLRKREMTVVAVSLGVPFFYDPSLDFNSSSKAIRNASVVYARKGIDFASEIEADIIYACSMKRGPPRERSKTLRHLGESLSECAQYAEARGVRFALEPFPTGEIPTVEDAMNFITGAGIGNIGVLIDSGHAAIVEESLSRAVRLSKGRITHVHLNNNDGISDLHWPPQKGKLSEVSLSDFLKALRDHGYDGKMSLEISKPRPIAETLIGSRFFIESILKAL